MTNEGMDDSTESVFAGDIDPLPDVLPMEAEDEIGAFVEQFFAPPDKPKTPAKKRKWKK